jgi:hypothetical protein
MFMVAFVIVGLFVAIGATILVCGKSPPNLSNTDVDESQPTFSIMSPEEQFDIDGDEDEVVHRRRRTPPTDEEEAETADIAGDM